MEGRRLGPANGGDRLPWLEPAEPDVAAEEERGGRGPLVPILVALFLVLAAGAGAWALMSGGEVDEGHGELIEAPLGDYKIRAPEPGGMEVEGEGDAAFPTSEGEDAHASLDLSRVPETPVALPKAQNKGGAGAETPLNRASSTIQLGAFRSEKAASDAWKALAKRFTYLETLSFTVIPVEEEDKPTLYRLRASGANAAPACARLRIAGEDCATLN